MRDLPEFEIIQVISSSANTPGFYYQLELEDGWWGDWIGPFESSFAAVLALVTHTAETYFTEEDKENE